MDSIYALSIATFGSLILSTQAYAQDKLMHIDELSNYPSQIQSELNELETACGELNFDYNADSPNYQADTASYHGEFVPLYVEPGFISKADITGDGIDDYILDVAKQNCEYSASMWGNWPYFKVYQGMRNNGAILIHEGASFAYFEESIYPRFVSNNKGFFDIQFVGTGGQCGQEGDYSFAGMEACEITERWSRKYKGMDLVSVTSINNL
ncbi:hypothetical protein [Psychrobacter sp. UBA3480]|uniref:hypothetical protein n=1 Tax=Psychrobacter sp. UBA3480 TaxID=1947350 RepID=UPI0025F80B7B|nr:hypothetical protein [Psychrobacter sp. UBA3480]